MKDMKKTNLIICPNCELKRDANGHSIRQILGEVTDRGDVLILRFHDGYTIVSGQDFNIRCGKCLEIVYYRRQDYEKISITQEVKCFNGSMVM